MLRSPPAWRLPGLLHHEPRFHSSTEFLDSRQSQHRAASAPCSYHRASRRKSVIGSRREDAASAVPVSTKRRDTGDTTMGLDPALREHYKSPSTAADDPERHFNRSRILSSPACAQPSSSLAPGAPAAPMEPMTSSPSLITTPPPKNMTCGSLASGAIESSPFARSAKASVSFLNDTLVYALS